MAEDFIIVGSDGTEHHFPDGMDPQRAIQVVKNAELAKANAKPLSEPTTYEGGRNRSIADTISKTGGGIIKGVTSMFSRAPEKTADQLDQEVRSTPARFDPAGAGRRIIAGLKSTAHNLTTPEGGGEAIGELATLGGIGRATDVVGKASTLSKGDVGRAMQTVGDFDLTKPLSSLKKAGQKLEASAANKSPDGVERYKPNTGSTPDQGVPQGEMPTGSHVDLESALDTLLRKNAEGEAESAPAQTDRVPYGGVEVPHKVRRPRMASEVANPFGGAEVSATRQQELLDRLGGTPSTEVGGRPVESPTGSASPVETQGAAETVPNAKPKLSAEEVAAVGRRMYGSRDAGSMLYGDSLPAAERAAAIKRLAPGPSRLPLTAEARINGQPRDLSLEEALAELIRAKGVE